MARAYCRAESSRGPLRVPSTTCPYWVATTLRWGPRVIASSAVEVRFAPFSTPWEGFGMTLAIGLVNPEGIVMAADSRQSYRHAAIRIGSDSAIKVFTLTDTVVAATSGYAFLRPQNAASAQNISTLVEDFKPTLPPTPTVLQVATALHA